MERLRSALLALIELQPETFSTTTEETMPNIVRRIEDNDLWKAVYLVGAIPSAWQHIGNAGNTRIKKYVANCRSDDAYKVILDAVEVPNLVRSATQSASRLSDQVIADLVRETTQPKILEIAVSRFTDSRSFDSANKRGKLLILPVLSDLSKDQRRAIRTSILVNKEVAGSFIAPRIIQLLLDLETAKAKPVPRNWRDYYEDLGKSETAPYSKDVKVVIEATFPELSCSTREDGQ